MACQELQVGLEADARPQGSLEMVARPQGSLEMSARPQADGVCRSFNFTTQDFLATFAGEQLITFDGEYLTVIT